MEKLYESHFKNNLLFYFDSIDFIEWIASFPPVPLRDLPFFITFYNGGSILLLREAMNLGTCLCVYFYLVS